MSEVCFMASSTYVPGLLHQELGLTRSSKESLAVVPSIGMKQGMVRSGSGLLHVRSPLVGDPLKPNGWLFSDQCARIDPAARNVLIDVQDTRSNSILFSFGISEHCTRREKILRYLMSGSNEAEKDGIDFSVISSLTGIQTSAIEMRLRSLVPCDDGICLYEVGGNERSSLICPSGFYATNPLLDPMVDIARASTYTVHPNGQILFTGTEVEMKDLISVFTEFHLSNKWGKQPMLVPHFTRLDTNESNTKIHGSSSSLMPKALTFTPMKSPETIKLKPSPKKRSSRKAGRSKDLSQRTSLQAFESLLSLVLDKNRGRTAILSVKQNGTELSELLIQFSGWIAGTGLAVLLSVVSKVFSGGTSVYATSTLFNTGFGSALVWLSWAVNKLRGRIVYITKSSLKAGFNEKEMMRKVDRNVNEIFVSAATIMAIGVLRFASV